MNFITNFLNFLPNIFCNSFMSNTQTNNQNTQNPQTDEAWTPEPVPQLTVDVYRRDDIIYVVSTVAGVTNEDLDVSIDNNVLSIKGIRRKPYVDSDCDLLLNECFWGEFYRELTINEKIDISKIKADLNAGILVIEIPIDKMLTRKISVGLVN